MEFLFLSSIEHPASRIFSLFVLQYIET